MPALAARIASSGSLALMVIDERPIRAAAIKAYEKAEKQIASARSQIEAFEAGDMPAFSRWEAQTFGALMSEIRDISMDLAKKIEILELVEEEMFWEGCTRVKAYRRVMEAKSNPTPPPQHQSEERDPWDDPDRQDDSDDASSFGDDAMPDGEDGMPGIDVDAYDRMSKHQQREFREAYEDMAELFSMMTGQPAPTFEAMLEHERTKRDRAHGASSAPNSRGESAGKPGHDRVKELYRTLVRRLHPDLHGALTPRERDLWQQVQDAYRTRDLEWLESIAGRLDAAHHGTTSLSIQILRRLTRDLQAALNGLRSQLSRHRKHPAWNFREHSANLAKFAAKRRHELETQRADLKRQLDYATKDLASLEERANRPAKKKKGRKSTPAPPEPSPWDAEQDAFHF